MSKLLEIRWHGRGGQGTKTASLLLADVAWGTGMQVQGFPEYGPERMGAPITAYNRISNEKITIHSNIYEPDFVVVVDDSLIELVDVTAGLPKDGAIIVNTSQTPAEVKAKLKNYEGNIYTIDAKKISIDCLGRYFPNIPMLGAIIKVSGFISPQDATKALRPLLEETFANKPNVIDGNVEAFERSIQEVIS